MNGISAMTMAEETPRVTAAVWCSIWRTVTGMVLE